MGKDIKNGRNEEEICVYFNSKTIPQGGTKYKCIRWYNNGELHREDGPAVEWPYGSKEWYLNGVELTEEEFNVWLAKKNLNEKLNVILDDKQSVKKVKI